MCSHDRGNSMFFQETAHVFWDVTYSISLFSVFTATNFPRFHRHYQQLAYRKVCVGIATFQAMLPGNNLMALSQAVFISLCSQNMTLIQNSPLNLPGAPTCEHINEYISKHINITKKNPHNISHTLYVYLCNSVIFTASILSCMSLDVTHLYKYVSSLLIIISNSCTRTFFSVKFSFLLAKQAGFLFDSLYSAIIPSFFDVTDAAWEHRYFNGSSLCITDVLIKSSPFYWNFDVHKTKPLLPWKAGCLLLGY